MLLAPPHPQQAQPSPADAHLHDRPRGTDLGSSVTLQLTFPPVCLLPCKQSCSVAQTLGMSDASPSRCPTWWFQELLACADLPFQCWQLGISPHLVCACSSLVRTGVAHCFSLPTAAFLNHSQPCKKKTKTAFPALFHLPNLWQQQPAGPSVPDTGQQWAVLVLPPRAAACHAVPAASPQPCCGTSWPLSLPLHGEQMKAKREA